MPFFEVDVFFCFSRDGCNQLRDHFTTLQLELSNSYLPSKHRKAGQLPISIRKKNTLYKSILPKHPKHTMFFFGKLSIMAYIESPPPKKNTPKKNYPSRHHFYFRPNKNPSQSFLSSDISSKETSPDSLERGG